MGGGESAKMRRMSTGDLPEVLGIEKVSFLAPWTQGMFEGTLASTVTNCLVIERSGSILGYIVFYFAGPEVHIMNIAVHPDTRRQGLAREMLSVVLALARERRVEECLLEVRESNAPARGLYEKFGFEAVGRRRGYYQESGEDALVMKLFLQ